MDWQVLREVLIALVTVFTTVTSALFASKKASDITAHRIDKLEKKVDMHNGLDRRVFALEEARRHADRRDEK